MSNTSGADTEQGMDTSIRDLPRELWKMAVDEWNRRTTFGRLIYPIWLLENGLYWLSMGLFIGSMLLFFGSVKKVFQSSDDAESPFNDFFEVYRDE